MGVTPALVATWGDGLFIVSGGTMQHEMANRSVRALASEGQGSTLAIVDRCLLCRRSPAGLWSTIAASQMDLACCVAVGGIIYAGTDNASVLRVGPDGKMEQLRGFEDVVGRDMWYAGGALIDGKFLGPPLGVRTMTATSDGAVLLANVHVGGIPRSVDGGETWQPTIDIRSDVHEVRAHPHRPNLVAAASAIGLCTSRDGGTTWEIEQRGLHASHCSAVAFAGDDIFVSAAADPFAPEGALYRRGVDERCPLVRVISGLPPWLGGIVDTGCIAAKGSAVAIADQKGNLYVSADNGRTWSQLADGIPSPSNVLML